MPILLFFVTILFSSVSAQADVQARNEQVVLLHGIFRSSAHMEEIEEVLEQKGFTVHNLDYPSTEFPLEQLASMVATDLRQKIDPSKPVHFVGYSMGGIVTRIVLNKYRPDNLGRVVQLASPNGGSEVADFLKENWFYETFYGPAGQQLVTKDAGIEALMGKVDYPLGVVAGNFSIDPVSSAIIPGEDDGKVSVQSTKVSGMLDHVTVYASHTFFPQNKTVQSQTLNFLKFGAFVK
ncbi:MAG: alpha/beta fold hydrolase [Rhizobiaceae bacterium]|nr:alpha/beta fold hydrolase [Rhizobiaceae bacterium]